MTIEHLETVHEEEKQQANTNICIKRNLAPTNSSDGECQFSYNSRTIFFENTIFFTKLVTWDFAFN